MPYARLDCVGVNEELNAYYAAGSFEKWEVLMDTVNIKRKLFELKNVKRVSFYYNILRNEGAL